MSSNSQMDKQTGTPVQGVLLSNFFLNERTIDTI